MTQILKQDKNKPYSLGEEIVVLWAAHKGYLDTVAVNDVEKFEKRMIEIVRMKGHDITKTVQTEKIISPKRKQNLKS